VGFPHYSLAASRALGAAGLDLWRDNLGENGAAIWIGGGGRSDVMIRVWRGDAQALF
jgi:hypothetical protein